MLLCKYAPSQWPGRIFKIPTPTGWQVVLTDPTHIDDIRKAPEYVLSANKVIEDVCWNSLFDIINSNFTTFIRFYNRDSLSIATCRIKSTFQSSERDSQKKYRDSSRMFTRRWPKLAINTFLPNMVYFKIFLYNQSLQSPQNGLVSSLLNV